MKILWLVIGATGGRKMSEEACPQVGLQLVFRVNEVGFEPSTSRLLFDALPTEQPYLFDMHLSSVFRTSNIHLKNQS